jgi:hypothetical protein
MKSRKGCCGCSNASEISHEYLRIQRCAFISAGLSVVIRDILQDNKIEMSTTRGFVEEVSRDFMETILKREVGYRMTNNAYPYTLAADWPEQAHISVLH